MPSSAAARALYPDAPAVTVAFEAPRRARVRRFRNQRGVFAGEGRAPLAARRCTRARQTRRASRLADAHAFASNRAGRRVHQPALRAARLAKRTASPSQRARTTAQPRRLQHGAGKRISLEFGSANPTGPLVVVQGRTLSIGDALANAMRFCGYDVFTEWIINDAGAQIERLGRSLYARYRQIDDPAFPFPEDGYPGEYFVADRARDLRPRRRRMDRTRPKPTGCRISKPSAATRSSREQQRTAERFGVHYDLWQSEKELHDSGKIRQGIERLASSA